MTSWMSTAFRVALASVVVNRLARASGRPCCLMYVRQPASGKWQKATLTVSQEDYQWFVEKIDRELLTAGRLGAGGLERQCSEPATLILDVTVHLPDECFDDL